MLTDTDMSAPPSLGTPDAPKGTTFSGDLFLGRRKSFLFAVLGQEQAGEALTVKKPSFANR
jgi:hypothetical protein